MKKTQAVFLGIIMSALVIALGYVVYDSLMPEDGGPTDIVKPAVPTAQIRNFEECAAAGNAVRESFPRQCSADGQVFVETVSEDRTGAMTEPEARLIARKTCIKEGEALGIGIYNEATKTWQFGASLNYSKVGCYPVCVVREETSTAEINWQCTEILPQGASLTSRKWVLVASKVDEQVTYLKKREAFSLLFGDDGNVAIGTDCNGMSAPYTAKDGKISLGEIATTLMYCEGSQEQEFTALLRGVSTYEITPFGDPLLRLFSGKNTIVFRGVEK